MYGRVVKASLYCTYCWRSAVALPPPCCRFLGSSFAARQISKTQSMELSSSARLTHSRHFDTVRHGVDGLTVPAGLILALATSLSARDLHEVRKQRTSVHTLRVVAVLKGTYACVCVCLCWVHTKLQGSPERLFLSMCCSSSRKNRRFNL